MTTTSRAVCDNRISMKQSKRQFTRTLNKLRTRALCAPKGCKTSRLKDLQKFMRKALEEGI